MSLNNTTVAYNVADVNLTGSGDGGGLANDTLSTGSLNIANSIVARNINKAFTAPDCHGTIYTWAYNLVENVSGCTLTGSLLGRITGQNPLLGALEYNGGPVLGGGQQLWSQALLPYSPAIDTGNAGTPGANIHYCARTDEVGTTRPQGGRCDLGAFEYVPPVFLPFIRH